MKIKLIYAGILVLFLVSCKTSHSFYSNKGELKNISDARLLKSINSTSNKCATVMFKKFKASIDFNGESKSFKGNLFLQKDSSIIISINPLMGIELFRVRLSDNNVEILDRTKRKYITGSYDILWEKFMLDMNFKTLQNIVLNELYIYPTDSDISAGIKRYKHTTDGDVYKFGSIKSSRMARKSRKGQHKDLILHEFSVLPEVFKINRSYIMDFSDSASVNIHYSDFVETVTGLFATKMLIKGSRHNQNFQINLSFPDVEFDGDHSIGFKVSKKYSQERFQ